jgi:hypothetical protein
MNDTKAISDATTAGRIFNVSRWTLEVERYDWYNQVNAWTNPEVAGLVPLIVDRHLGCYVWHLAGLA